MQKKSAINRTSVGPVSCAITDPNFIIPRLMVGFLLPYRKYVAIILLLGFFSTGLLAIQPLLGQWIIDHVFIIKDVTLLKALVSGGGLLACAYSLSMGTKYLYLRMSLQVMTDMRLEMYRRVLGLPLRLTLQKRAGDVVARLHEDLAETQRVYTESLMQAVTLFVELMLSAVLLWYLDGKLLLLCLLLLPLLVWTTQKFRFLLYEETMKLRRQTSDNYSFVLDGLTSIRFIRATGLESWMGNRYRIGLEGIASQQMRLSFLNAASQGAAQVILLAAALATLWFIGQEVVAGEMSLGMLLAYTAYQARFFTGIQAISQLYLRFEKGKASIHRVTEFFTQDHEQDGTEEAPSDLSDLIFQQVSYRAQGDLEILKSVNFTLSKGEKIGLTGKSGVGKSTFADLIMNIHRPDQGSIDYGGKDIRHFTRASWTQRVCMIAHDFPLWHGTVEEVLKVGKPEVTEVEMIEALKDVGLWEELGQRREALQTKVGEKGLALSAGQKQRLQLARACLQDLDILILDEATCHLDTEAEREVFSWIQKRWRTKSIIVITHRLENLNWMDRLYAMSDGKLIEQDQWKKVVMYG